MIFYIFLGLLLVTVVTLFVRSAVFKAVMRGRGADAGRFGSQLDHFYDQQGTGQGWKDDGCGARGSHIDPKHTHRHDETL